MHWTRAATMRRLVRVKHSNLLRARIAPCLLGVALLLLGFPRGAGAGTPAPADPLIPLTLSVTDSETGLPLAARLSVLDASGKPRWPADTTSFYHAVALGYFYTRGTCTVLVPAGRVTIAAHHGYAWRPAADTVIVSTPTTRTIRVARWIDLPALSLWTGDTHAHINHGGGTYIMRPSDAWWMGQAEGLNVVSCLDNDWYFTGGPDPVSTPDCVVAMGEENRAWVYGHLSMLGLSRLVQPVSGEPYWPLLMDLADSARAQGAITIAAHPLTDGFFYATGAWPGSGIARELPADLWRGRVDAIDIASNSNYAGHGIDTATWYHALGCGFRIAPSAGTDAAMNRTTDLPLGGWQVIVGLDGAPFSFATWCQQLKRGRCFVTNGPIITRFTVNGKPAGDSVDVSLAEPRSVDVAVSVRSHDSISRVDIVRNGVVATSLVLPAGTTAIDTTVAIETAGSAWIAARVSGRLPSVRTPGDSLFAHTGAVYALVGGARILVPGDATYFASWLDGMRSVLDMNLAWSSPSDSARAYAEVEAARNYYIGLASGGATAVAQGTTPPASMALRCVTQPARGHAELEVASAAARAALVVLDAAGRVVRRLEVAGAGLHRVGWDGVSDAGVPLPAGVYWALAQAGDRRAQVRFVFLR